MTKIFKNKNFLLGLILSFAFLLRIHNLSQVPNGLYWDEMDVGYQAYSIFTTGRDYFGNVLPVHFHSFGDWRVPLYIYTSVPTVFLFGLTSLGVRLPAVIFGTIGILFVYLLTKELFGKKEVALLAASVLAFSPWHIQYSRMAFEQTLVLTTFLAGAYFFFASFKNPKLLALSALSFGLSPWAYNTAKLFVPAVLAVLLVLYRKQILALPKRYLKISALVLIFLALPLLFGTLFGRGGMRFTELTIFTNTHIRQEAQRKLDEAAVARYGEKLVGKRPAVIDKLAHNKFTYWANIATANYFQSFSTDFLFLNGDSNLRHSPSSVGQMYKVEAIALVLGIIALYMARKRYPREARLLLFWTALAPLPSAITLDGGTHASRLFFLLPPLSMFVALGVYFVYKNARNSRLIVSSYAVFWGLGALLFLQSYFVHYKLESAPHFNYGFDQAAKYAFANKDKYDLVVIDAGKKESALMAYLFANKVNPGKFQSLHPMPVVEPADGVAGNKIDNVLLLFPGERTWPDILNDRRIPGRILVLRIAEEIEQDLKLAQERLKGQAKIIDTIDYPDGRIEFLIIDGG